MGPINSNLPPFIITPQKFGTKNLWIGSKYFCLTQKSTEPYRAYSWQKQIRLCVDRVYREEIILVLSKLLILLVKIRNRSRTVIHCDKQKPELDKIEKYCDWFKFKKWTFRWVSDRNNSIATWNLPYFRFIYRVQKRRFFQEILKRSCSTIGRSTTTNRIFWRVFALA